MTSVDDVVGVVVELRDGRNVRFDVVGEFSWKRHFLYHEGVEQVCLSFLTLPPLIEVPCSQLEQTS